MPLLPDEFEQVEQIARQIAKKEIEAMGKGLEEVDKKLETEIKDLEAEMRKAIHSAPADIKTSTPSKKEVFKNR